MRQEGSLKLTFEKPVDTQNALQTVKRVLKEYDCEYWHKCVAADNNRIIIGDGLEPYPIDYFEFEGVLAAIGKALAIDDPERSFSGESSFSNSTTGWSGYDIVKYQKTTHILYVRQNTTDGYFSVPCGNCQEDVFIDLSEYDGETELLCENCGENVSLDEIADEYLWSDSRFYLIKDGKAELELEPTAFVEESDSLSTDKNG